jgi:CBS domain-containing protein
MPRPVPFLEVPVKHVMTPRPATVGPEDSLGDAAALIARSRSTTPPGAANVLTVRITSAGPRRARPKLTPSSAPASLACRP